MRENLPRKKKIIELTLIVLGVLLFLFVIHRFAGWISLSNYLSLITACVLIYIPIIVLSQKKQKVDFIDIKIKGFFRGVKLSLFFSVLTLVPLLLLAYLIPMMSFRDESIAHYLEFTVYQFIMVALPEEFFFRGFLQNQLNLIFHRNWKWFGVQVGPALIWTSVIFALSHSVISLQVWHPLIFIPSLAFGWLYEKNKTITASVIYHALCNILAYAILIHF